MSHIRKIVVQVRKKVYPNVLDFAEELAEKQVAEHLRVHVISGDDHNELVHLEVTGHALQYQNITSAISSLGGVVESIEEVELEATSPVDADTAGYES